MVTAVSTALVSAGLTQEQVVSLNERNGEDLTPEDLPYITVEDLISVGVGRARSRRLVQNVLTAASDPPKQPFVVELKERKPDVMTVPRALFILSGQEEPPPPESPLPSTKEEIAEFLDHQAGSPYVVLTKDGEIDTLATAACLSETQKHGAQRTWEGAAVVRARSLVGSSKRYRCPAFRDLLTPSLYNNPARIRVRGVLQYRKKER